MPSGLQRLPASEMLMQLGDEATTNAAVAAAAATGATTTFLSPSHCAPRSQSGWCFLRPKALAIGAFLEAGSAKARASARAHHILAEADKFVRDGQLTMLELCTFLPHTEHEGFLEWLLRSKYHEGGHWDYHAQFKAMDTNKDHKLSFDELLVAVQAWLEEGSPPLSVPHNVGGADTDDSGAGEADILWVGGIPDDLAASQENGQGSLHALFSPFGSGVTVTLRVKDGDRSWALVTFEQSTDAEAALAATLTHGSTALNIQRADVETHLKKPKTGELGRVYAVRHRRAAIC